MSREDPIELMARALAAGAWEDAAGAARAAAERRERHHGVGDPFAAMLRDLVLWCAKRAEEKAPRR